MRFRFDRKILVNVFMAVVAILAVITASFSGFAAQCEELPQEVLRLHILANSNSDEDQTLKYQLRDYIIEDMNEIFKDFEMLQDAVSEVSHKINQISEKAEGFVHGQGFDYAVKAELCEMYFTTRVYENITMPAGNYMALRIIIGEGEGQNWWCVLFPPLCLPACAGKKDEAFFSEEISRLIEQGGGKPEYKFAIYEWFISLFVKKD